MAVGLLLFCAGPKLDLHAQVGTGADERNRCVGVALAPQHWISGALRRLQALGALREYTPVRSVDLCRAHTLLGRAIDEAPGGDVALLAANLRRRLEREFPGLEPAPAEGSDRNTLHLSLSAGGTARDGAAVPGVAEFEPDRTGATALADEASLRFGVDVGLVTGSTVAVRAAPVLDRGEISVEALEAVLGLGPVAVTAGRGSVGFGAVEGGGVVLSGGRFDRVQVESRGTWNLPRPLRPLGRIGFTTFIAVLRESRHPDDSYFWGASGSLQPHWRTTFYVHRGAMIRLDEDQPFTGRRLWTLLVGDVEGLGFENQVVSVEGRFHLPTESVLPLTAYLEWGAEDAAGAWWDVPARIVGVEVPAIPGTASLSVGIERASFAVRCCSNPGWYRHSSLSGGWVVNDVPLGRALGGNGTEWLAFGGVDGGSRLRVDARVFLRERGPDNLYTPGREGDSWGGTARFMWRIPAGPEIFGDVTMEQGSGWREQRAALGGRWTFGR